jgi:hypothetical protein
MRRIGGNVEERYVCWGADAEDFTELLQQKYDAGEMPYFYMQDEEEHWKFQVTCSQGHKNAFSGTGRP